MRTIARNGMLLLGLGLLANIGRGEDPAQPNADGITAKVCGLQVIGKGYGKGDDEIRPLNSFESGTGIGIMMQAPKGAFIEFLDSDSRVKTLSDDKGTDLLVGESRFSTPGFSMMPRFSKDRHVALLEVRGPGVPVAGSTSITVEGTATFLFSPTGKTETAKNDAVDIVKGSKVTFGATTMKIHEAGKPAWGEDPLSVQFECKGTDLHVIKSITFADAQGTKVEAEQRTSSRFGSGEDAVYNVEYHLKQKLEKASVTIEYWADAKKVSVAVSVKVGVGQ